MPQEDMIKVAGIVVAQGIVLYLAFWKERKSRQSSMENTIQTMVSDKIDGVSEGLKCAVAQIGELSKALGVQGQNLAGQMEQVKEHQRQLESLWKGANCYNPQCAMRDQYKTAHDKVVLLRSAGLNQDPG